jgi:hypothetical protein
MVTIEQLDIKLKEYILSQVDSLAKDTPIVNFIKPIITRVVDKNFTKVKSLLGLIADEEGKIDIENILTEMTESVMKSKPFTFNTGILGDLEIGDGNIKMKIPMINKSLVFNSEDLDGLKEALTSKS